MIDTSWLIARLPNSLFCCCMFTRKQLLHIAPNCCHNLKVSGHLLRKKHTRAQCKGGVGCLVDELQHMAVWIKIY
jgi:hypothetical protein